MSLPIVEASNPRIPRKKGQPAKSKKHSDLYTDEDPKGTIPVSYTHLTLPTNDRV